MVSKRLKEERLSGVGISLHFSLRDDSAGCPIQFPSWNQEKGKPRTVAESTMKHPLYKVKLAVRTTCAYFDEFELEPRTLSPFEKALYIRM